MTDEVGHVKESHMLMIERDSKSFGTSIPLPQQQPDHERYEAGFHDGQWSCTVGMYSAIYVDVEETTRHKLLA